MGSILPIFLLTLLLLICMIEEGTELGGNLKRFSHRENLVIYVSLCQM